MAIWGKKSRGSVQSGASAASAFWAWWGQEGAAAVATALDQKTGGQGIVDMLSPRVKAVHPDLSWELGPGVPSARYMLTISASGDPQLRATARRWLRAAPSADETWRFTDTKQASPQAALEVRGRRITAAETVMKAEVDDAQRPVNVQLFHPAFTGDQEFANLAGFLLLDQLLGEAEVETWVAAVEPSTTPLTGGQPLSDLPGIVAEISRAPDGTPPDANVSWVLLDGTDDRGRPRIASVSVPLRPMISPTFDTHVELSLAYTESNAGGLPVGESYERLNALEDHLTRLVAGVGRVVAHETSAGVRKYHFYVDGTTPAAEQLDAGLAGWSESKPRVRVRPDPAWDAVRHLRG